MRSRRWRLELNAFKSLGAIPERVQTTRASRSGSETKGQVTGSDEFSAPTGSMRQLLDAFIPPKGADGSYGNHTGYAIRGDGYLALEDAITILKVDDFQARDMLDRLLAHNILRRGLLLNCFRCRSEDFYRIEQVGSIFECHACGHDSELSRGRWYEKD